MIKFKKLHPDAVIPKRASDGAGGFDLSLADHVHLQTSSTWCPTGIAVAIPIGYVGLIRIRSSLARNNLEVVAGVIDSDYRGEIKIGIVNHGYGCPRYQAGTRIAQLLVVPCLQEAVEVEDLDATVRGEGGFGSTGTHLLTENEVVLPKASGQLNSLIAESLKRGLTVQGTVTGRLEAQSVAEKTLTRNIEQSLGLPPGHLAKDLDRTDYTNPANVLRDCAEQLAETQGLEVDHQSFDDAAKAMERVWKGPAKVEVRATDSTGQLGPWLTVENSVLVVNTPELRDALQTVAESEYFYTETRDEIFRLLKRLNAAADNSTKSGEPHHEIEN